VYKDLLYLLYIADLPDLTLGTTIATYADILVAHNNLIEISEFTKKSLLHSEVAKKNGKSKLMGQDQYNVTFITHYKRVHQ